MSIRINPAGEVRMIIPPNVSFSEAEKFLFQKRDWIERTKKRLEGNRKEKTLYTKDNLPRTRYHEFLISPAVDNTLSYCLSQGLCEIFIPPGMETRSPEVQEWIEKAIVETLRREAKVILVARCRELAEKLGISINNVRVKNMKTRWGSCSTRGNINLNIHLMRVPENLMDYVIYHELVHTIHHNHSAAFWRELDRHVGDARMLAREIRKWGWVLEN